MSKLCQCNCGKCTGLCGCTTDDSGAYSTTGVTCYLCATPERETALLTPFWFLTSLKCVKNTVPDAGVDVHFTQQEDLEIAWGSPNIPVLRPVVAANEPTTIAPAGPYKWIRDPTLVSGDFRIRNARPRYELWRGGSNADACVSGANHLIGGSGTQRTNGWHIGFGYDTAGATINPLRYPFYPSKPPVIPLVPNVDYVYGAILLDTNVRLGWTGDPFILDENGKVCVNAIAWLRAEFLLGRVPDSDPLLYRFLTYNIPIWEFDGRKPNDSFCAMQAICLPRRRLITTPQGLEQYFTGGNGCVAGYKWKQRGCLIGPANPSTAATITGSGSVSYSSSFVATVDVGATVTWTYACVTNTEVATGLFTKTYLCDPGSTLTVSGGNASIFQHDNWTPPPGHIGVAPPYIGVETYDPTDLADPDLRLFPHIACANCGCPGIFNTGEEAIDNRDEHWEIETAEGSGTFIPAWTYPAQPLHYDPSGDNAMWIGLEDGVAFPSDEVRLFRLRFDLTDPPADITGTLYADNGVDSININGTVIATSIGSFPYTITLPAAELITGTNELLIEVHGDGIVTDGLLVFWDD